VPIIAIFGTIDAKLTYGFLPPILTIFCDGSKAISTAKFYLFDPGVTNFLMGRKSVSPRTPEFGTLFEQMLHSEIKAYLDYHRMHDCLFHWRSTSQAAVVFLIREKPRLLENNLEILPLRLFLEMPWGGGLL
jgi:predicted AAA+ superfamily ATPase